MKICMVAYAYYDIDRRIRNYSEALVESGHTVDVIAISRINEKKPYYIKGVKVLPILKREYNEKGIYEFIFRILKFMIKGSFLLLLKHLKNHYDVIHVHNVPDFLVFMTFFPKLLGAKIILDIHDIMPEFFCQKFSKGFDSKINCLLLNIEKLSTNVADQVIIANHLWQNKIEKRCKLWPKKSCVILNYPNLNMFNANYKLREANHKIIYPGTISRHHGIDIAIKAIFFVRKKIPDVELLIYGRSGDENYYKYLEDLIDKKNLKDSVKILEPVSHEQLKEIYKNVSIGIIPKRPGIFSSEAFSTKIFDFFASGLPVVISKTTIDEYYFDDEIVRFFEPENEEDLANAIISLLTDSSLREKMITNGLKYAKENNWDDKKHIYLDIINSLTGHKKNC